MLIRLDSHRRVPHFKRSTHMDTTYKTFWRRVGAGFIDSIVLIIVGLGTSMFTLQNNEVITPLSTIVDNSIWLIYSIYLHGRYGQTFGKMLLKIKVVTTNGDSISYLHAFKRDIVYLIMAIATLLTFYTHADEYDRYNESMNFIESVNRGVKPVRVAG